MKWHPVVANPNTLSSAIRISRIVSETFRLRLPGVRWFIMCDDDNVFFPDNLLTSLIRFDHHRMVRSHVRFGGKTKKIESG
jgi:hypothetical protein